MDPQTCDIELEGHDDEVEDLAEEEEEGVAVVLVLQVVPERPEHKVARWQNSISSFPWIAPGGRAWGAQSKERKGSNFAA